MTDDKTVKLVKGKHEFTREELAFMDDWDRHQKMSDEIDRRRKKLKKTTTTPTNYVLWTVSIICIIVSAALFVFSLELAKFKVAETRCNDYSAGTERATRLVGRTCFVQGRDELWYTLDEYKSILRETTKP